MSGLSAGEMDRDIVLQTGTTSDGGQTYQFEDAEGETIAAQWLPAGTREAWQAQERIGSYVDGVLRIYDMTPRPTPDGSQRVLFDGRIFDLKPYIEIGRGEGLEIPVVAHGE